MKVEFNNLPAKQELTIVTLGDYFGGGGPDVHLVITKEKFIEEQLYGEYSFEEFMEASGDGGDSYIVLTIWNNQIAVVG